MPLNALDLESNTYMVHGTKFESPKRYTIQEAVGDGGYGVVVAAQDTQMDESLAIKKIENAFEHITFAKRTLRELRLLRHLQHENVIDVRDVFLNGTREDFDDIYVVSELMETDLASILKSPQPLSDDHCQLFLYQMFRGMTFVHSAEVVHRDLKPRNLLVNSNCDLKICDFGLARVNFSAEEFGTAIMTEYVCTRWYRAPEVLCSWTDYGKAIDIWSAGCIFGEMLRRKPLFPGKNTQHQLQLVISFLGIPPKADLRRIPNDKCRKFIESLPVAPPKPMNETFTDVAPAALDLLGRILLFNPDARQPFDESLQHEYLSLLHCPEDEPVRQPLDTLEFEFERRKISIQALRHELFFESLQYYPQKLQQYCEELQHGSQTYNIADYRLLAPGESQDSDDEDG
eukprot:gnl/TRDRNA2_/TRDRNA2_177462_c0_seq1.p1 gnl/TRDRNA2_/TRDRNA2_177462_c0~~gnl/TRDRNA2_/TRDRNA2_177462_c0_seq1.p1  ORF type:complete len:401 (-),score=61.64 gnl/TRDRNA2_/TRDRNA2_177462_c0_seq1:362-1564(-)